MLSPGSYWQKVPKSRNDNLDFRRYLIRACKQRSNQRAALEICRRDVLFWINSFVWQYNPNTIGASSEEVGPFLTWGFQDEAVRLILDCIERRKDLLIEKSREMGASWLCLLIMDWMFLFHPWKKFLMISRSEEAVDKPGDSDSLFWKLDFVHEHLPDWMTKGVKRRRRGYRSANGSGITGQASTGKAGVGGRCTAMFIDEFPQIVEDYEVLHRTSDTTSCRIFNGTHRGPGTAFNELAQRVDIRKLVMHWTQHPDKARGRYRWDDEKKRCVSLDPTYDYPRDFQFVQEFRPTGGPFPGIRSPWYDEQCVRKGSSRAVAMDLDIDVTGSTSLFFDPVLVRRLIGEFCCDPYWQGDVSYDRDTGKPIALIPSPAGPLKLWCHLDTNGRPFSGLYAFGGDVSAGTGATPSCLSAADCVTGQKVLEYANAFIQPKDFGVLAVALCRLFGGKDGEPARLCWEKHGPGISFGGAVLETGFRNVYMHSMELPHSLELKISERPGWTPTPDTTRVLLEDYRSSLATRAFVNRSEAALKECLMFKYTPKGTVEHAEIESKNDPTGARLNHGDRVIADALCDKMVKDAGPPPARRKAERPLDPSSLAFRRALAQNRHREED